MARKQVSIQDSVENEEEFEAYLQAHAHQLICIEVYSDFCGPCLATNNAIRKGKLDIGGEEIAMVKALADNINCLSRFRDKSEPVFLFVVKGQLTQAMFGANGIELCRIIEDELNLMLKERKTGIQRPGKRAISEMLPEEAAKQKKDQKLEEESREAENRLRVLTLAARKKRVCERLAQHVTHLNFILFWPHCHHAHFDLYEKWDRIRVSVAAKEEIQLTEEVAREALYLSDVQPNAACLHSLTSGAALVVLFKMSESDGRDFVKLMRYALYEEIPLPKEDTPPAKQQPPIPAFERYASISKTTREVRRDRHNAMLQRQKEIKEEEERLAAEQARLVRQAEEDRLYEEKKLREEEKMARIAAGLPGTPPPEPTAEGEEEEHVEGEEPEVVIEEESVGVGVGTDDEKVVVQQEEVFHSDVEVEDEDYIPPGGLFVPGLYSPPNDLAKANALALFFPKQIKAVAGELESEVLPQHVMVMFNVEKRAEVMEVIAPIRKEIINLGIFVGEDLSSMEHLAYTVKQYNTMERVRRTKDRLVLMVSRKRSYPLLQLAGLNPCYISSDVSAGERECLQLFPVGYGDEYEEEESIVEEEEVQVLPPEPGAEGDEHGEGDEVDDDDEDD